MTYKFNWNRLNRITTYRDTSVFKSVHGLIKYPVETNANLFWCYPNDLMCGFFFCSKLAYDGCFAKLT
jgi:hypothetical protein